VKFALFIVAIAPAVALGLWAGRRLPAQNRG
jgi:hypothetical protein